MSEAYTIADPERMARATNYRRWQATLAAPALGRRVVEVGCGIGNFTAALLDREQVIAVDPEPACIRRIRERYAGHPNLHAVVCEPGSRVFADLARFQPDSCVCLNVLEHIEDDRAALAAMASILVTQGRLALQVPAFPALFGPIDRNLRHQRRYTRKSFASTARAVGLEIEKLHYLNAAGFFGWWMNAHLLRREAQSQSQIDLFDRRIVPWLSRLEAKAPPPFGQSLFAILRKP